MKLCVALDLPSSSQNMELVEKLAKYDNLWLKVGFRTYIRDGRYFIDTIKQLNPNFKIFLDLKLYDIPNTMADASEEIANLGIDMFNIHASSGERAMKAVMDRLAKYEERPLVLAVTALTSFDNDEFETIYGSSISKKAEEFAKSAYESGLDGVVCSAYESSDIKRVTDEGFLTLSPGIRPFAEDAGDQKRVADIEFACSNRVDFAVVGRPIYRDENPAQKVESILKKIEQSCKGE